MAGPDSGGLIKFLICARKKPDDTIENYFYNWGTIHVALMITTPVCMRVFKRYVQHYRILEVGSSDTIFPLSDSEWDSLADHWLEDYAGVKESITDISYIERLRNHEFGDKAFQLLLTSGRVVWEQNDFRSGGVKLVHWLKRRDDVPVEEFHRQWQGDYAEKVLEAFRNSGGLRKYVQNPQLQLDPEMFKGSLFHHAGVGGYAGLEEFWFDDLDALRRAAQNPDVAELVRSQAAVFADLSGVFSQVMMERVVFDFHTPSELSPRPGLDNSAGLEQQILNQGYKDWHVPGSG